MWGLERLPLPPPAWDPLLQRDGSLTGRRGRTSFPSSIRTAPRTGVGPSSQVGFWQNPPNQLAQSPLLAEACMHPVRVLSHKARLSAESLGF